MSNTDKDKRSDGASLDPEGVSARELSEARRFAEALESLDKGKSGLDLLPNLSKDSTLLGLAPMAHVLRAAEHDLETTHAKAIWDDLERRLAVAAQRAQRTLRWKELWTPLLSLASALGVLMLVFVAPDTTQPTVNPLREPAAAVNLVESQLPQYASSLLLESREPRGDTRLKALRDARFEAWRQDAGWKRRQNVSRGRR